MLLVIGLVFLIARFQEVRRFWPVLLPAIVLVHFAIPGTLGTLKQSFAPTALLEEQRYESGGEQPGGGRLADIGPTFDEWWRAPSSARDSERDTMYDPGSGQVPNAIILDNQWLATCSKSAW